MHAHAFSFSLCCAGSPTLEGWREVVRSAEDVGYDSLLMTDHLHQHLAPIPALVAAASWTRTLRLGTLVLCQDLRNPAVLARELATVDLLSGGRLDIGIGGGWLASDYHGAGLPFETSGRARFERFRETVDILVGSVADPRFAFEGHHHRAGAVEGGARCVQSPRPPLLIGASRRKMLSFAAARADIVNFAPTSHDDFTTESLEQKIAWVKEGAGERFPRLKLGHLLWECFVTPSPRDVVAALSRSLRCTAEELQANPSLLVGSPEQLADILLERRERWGLTHVTVPQSAAKPFGAVIKLLKSQPARHESGSRTQRS